MGVGAGYTFGGTWGYGYAMVDPELFVTDEAIGALKPSLGGVFYTGYGSKLTAEGGYRFYADGQRQWVGSLLQTVRLSQNNALKLSYDYRGKSEGVQRTFLISFAHYY